MGVYADFEIFKNSLTITPADRDALLEDALEDASRAIDDATDRRADGFTLDVAATARTYAVAGRSVWDCDTRRWMLLIDEIGSLTDLVVETGDGATWTSVVAGTGYRTAPDNALADGKPITALTAPSWGCDLVRVTARWGWPGVPRSIRRAAMILATRLYRRPGSPEGVAGGSDGAAVRLARQDPDVVTLLQPYQLPGIA